MKIEKSLLRFCTLNSMINFFGDRNALFVKYPLIGVPPLIQLGLLVAFFTPMANTLVPEVAKSPQISCKMRDVLLWYRPCTVRARLDKLSSSNTLIYKVLSEVMVQPYNEYGYNLTSIMDCEPVRRPCFSSMYLMDKFNTDHYCANWEISNCFRGYAELVRHQIEKLFPVKRLNALCVGPKQKEKAGTYNLNLFAKKYLITVFYMQCRLWLAHDLIKKGFCLWRRYW